MNESQKLPGDADADEMPTIKKKIKSEKISKIYGPNERENEDYVESWQLNYKVDGAEKVLFEIPLDDKKFLRDVKKQIEPLLLKPQAAKKENPNELEFLQRIEVLASRKPRLKMMLKPFYENPGSNRLDQPEYWDALIAKSIKNLKREDRIVWFLKKARGTRPAFQGKEPPDPLKSSDIDQLLTDITHYLGNAEVNNYQPVLNYTFKDQKSDKLLEDLKSLTEKSESLQKEKARLVEQGADKTFLKFEDGWQWHLLDRAGCEKEGAAMRHCGNVPSARKGQRILSLREPITTKKGKKMWKPHATFIWNSDGSLGEMKGFSNQKPKENLHPYIVKLLEDDKITKLKGGGYAAQNNFRISDLDEGLKDKLIEKRPELAPSGVDLEDLAQRIDEYIEGEEEHYSSEDWLGEYEYILEESFNDLAERQILDKVDSDVEDKVRYVLDVLEKKVSLSAVRLKLMKSPIHQTMLSPITIKVKQKRSYQKTLQKSGKASRKSNKIK
jgi:hypothetical protein